MSTWFDRVVHVLFSSRNRHHGTLTRFQQPRCHRQVHKNTRLPIVNIRTNISWYKCYLIYRLCTVPAQWCSYKSWDYLSTVWSFKPFTSINLCVIVMSGNASLNSRWRFSSGQPAIANNFSGAPRSWASSALNTPVRSWSKLDKNLTTGCGGSSTSSITSGWSKSKLIYGSSRYMLRHS